MLGLICVCGNIDLVVVVVVFRLVLYGHGDEVGARGAALAVRVRCVRAVRRVRVRCVRAVRQRVRARVCR